MKQTIIALLLATTLAASAQTYSNGTISRPNIFGDRTIRYQNGLQGTLSRPNIFGDQTLRYNNGAVINYSRPNIFGDREIRVQTMPRRSGW